MGLDEHLLTAREQAPGVMDVKEGHRDFPAVDVIIDDEALEGGAVREMDVPDLPCCR